MAGLPPRCPEVPCTDQPPLPPASQRQPVLLTSDLIPHTLLRPLRSAPSCPGLRPRLCPLFTLTLCRESWPLPSACTSALPLHQQLCHWFGIFLSNLFLMWTTFKVFIGFVTLLLLFYVLGFFWPRDMWDVSSLTRDQTCSPCIGK